MRKIYAALASCAVMLLGCSDITTEDYAANQPTLDIREFLNGPLEAWGIFYDRSGKVDKSFHVVMKGTWQANHGTLREDFVFSDGKTDQRTWQIEMTDDHHFSAKAHDVVGEARGSQHGNAVNMRYTLAVKRDNGDTIDLSMDDWMYLLDRHTLINHTKMKKFGLEVGELIVTFRKP